jgi:group II intron reverse transcriptase/maturase
MYYVAYQHIYAKPGNMTAGSDGKTIDEMSLTRIEQLITSLKDESYQPQPSRRVYIPKKNGKMRPLGVPTFNDKLVQEVVRMILEAIYEGSFEHSSHGFRPKRSCHTSLAQIKKSFNGAKWFIEGDIKGFFDNINHDVLINILKERISDERFLRLIRKFANAGYVEDWKFHKTYSGTPQGGIVSPILANIYLDKLDKYMKKYTMNFDCGKGRKRNNECRRLERQKRLAVKSLKSVEDESVRTELIEQIKSISKQIFQTPYGNEMDTEYKRLKYVRYADDFIIGIIGNKEEAKRIKEDISKYLQDELKLELSEEKTLITHTEKPALFLGYEIAVWKSNYIKRMENGYLSRTVNKVVRLSIPKNAIRHKLLEYDAVEFKCHDGVERWKPKARAILVDNESLEILYRYNAEIRGLYNYYALANNCSNLNTFKYIMEYSMYKTFAWKYRTSVKKLCKKYKKDGVFTISFTDSKGKCKQAVFYNKGFKKMNPGVESKYDNLPNGNFCLSKTSLTDRLKRRKCELCGATDSVEMHHIRKLKDLKGKADWQKAMIARKRKTIAVCRPCHLKIHKG